MYKVVVRMPENIIAPEAAEAAPDQKRQQAIIEALAGIFSYASYVDLTTLTFQGITAGGAVTEIIGQSGPARQAAETYVDSLVHPDYREQMKSFFNVETLKERLAEQDLVSEEYLTSRLGWQRGTFLAAGRDDNGAPVGAVLGIRSVSGEKPKEAKLLAAMTDTAEKASYDPITGVRSSRFLEENRRELAGCAALAMAQVDGFLSIVDAHGLIAGDMVLRYAAREMLNCLSQEDTVIHYGRNIFVIGFQTGSEKEILNRLEKIRRSVETMHVPHYPKIRATISIGCGFRSDSPDLFMTADKMLYRAKQTKNMVAV